MDCHKIQFQNSGFIVLLLVDPLLFRPLAVKYLKYLLDRLGLTLVQTFMVPGLNFPLAPYSYQQCTFLVDDHNICTMHSHCIHTAIDIEGSICSNEQLIAC